MEIPFSFLNRITSATAMGISGTEQISLTPSSVDESSQYSSPYRLVFDFSWADLIAGFNQAPYNQWTGEGNSPSFSDPSSWYDYATYAKNPDAGSVHWGPEPNLFPAVNIPTNVTNQTNNWLRQRLVAVAASMIGYGYRHHHIPDWNPDQSWYDKASGPVSPMPPNTLIGQGIDCSDYTAWLYNYGLGIYLTTSVAQQANMTSVQDSNNMQRVADATLSFAQLLQTLNTGDLLFIAGNPTVSKADIQNQLSNPANLQITHVIMWLGKNGIANNIPLVTDSHGAGMLDENGKIIPTGVQVRPFNNTTIPITTATTDSSPAWYFEHFAWALRILPD